MCDVYFLPPARMQPDETAQQFAERVRSYSLCASSYVQTCLNRRCWWHAERGARSVLGLMMPGDVKAPVFMCHVFLALS